MAFARTGGSPDAAMVSFDGLEAQQMTWTVDGRRTTVWLFDRFETMHAVLVSETVPTLSQGDIEELFELLP